MNLILRRQGVTWGTIKKHLIARVNQIAKREETSQKIFCMTPLNIPMKFQVIWKKVKELTENMAFKVGKGKDFEIIAINASSRNVNI